MCAVTRRELPGCLVLAVVVALGLSLGAGCGRLSEAQARGMHDALDAVTDAVDPAYGFAVAACDAREVVIVQRSGTTAAADSADVAQIRSECDRAFHAFEALRQAQAAARVAVDAAAGTDDAELLGHAVAAVQALGRAWEEVRQLVPAPAPRGGAPL